MCIRVLVSDANAWFYGFSTSQCWPLDIFSPSHHELFKKNHNLIHLSFHESVKRWCLCVSITMCPLWNPALQIVHSMLIGLRGGVMYCPVCWFDSVTVQIENTLSQWNTWFTKSGCDAGIHGSTSLWTTDFLPHERLAHSFLLLCWILQLLMVRATGVLAYIP